MPDKRTVPIAFVAGEYPRPSETFLLRELAALRARGLDFVVVATRRLPDNAEADGIDAPVVLRPRYFSLRALAAEVRFALTHPLRYLDILVTLYRGHWRSIDDLFQAMQNVPRALAVGYELRRLGVTRIHALWASLPATLGWIIARAFDMEFSFAAHSRDVFVEGRMLKAKAALARAVVVCNRAAETRLRDVLGERLARKVTLVHHGIAPEALPARAAPEDYILAAGRFEPKKGLDVLVRACGILAREDTALLRKPDVAGQSPATHQNMRGVRCIIVGDGPERARLESLVARERAPVELRGWMRHDELMSLMSRAAAVAVPSVEDRFGDRDGIPNLVLEAMAVGVPVVATDAGGVGEVVKDGETGRLAPAGDAGALAAKLRQALSADARNADITARANALIREQFALSKTVAALERLLRTPDG